MEIKTRGVFTPLEIFINIIPDETSKIKTYVGSDGKLHFVDRTGADSVLPFSSNEGVIKEKFKGTVSINVNMYNKTTNTVSGTISSGCIGLKNYVVAVTSADARVKAYSTSNAVAIAGVSSFTATYNPTNGVITVSATFTNSTGSSSNNSNTTKFNVTLYSTD